MPAGTESAREVVSALAARAGVRGEVTLRVSEAIGSPVLYGWRRPVVVVPTGWLESLAVDELRAMLAHEVAHVKRRDFLANTIQRLIEIPLFFHPSAWLASRRIVLAREELCDAWALSMGTDAASYARSLAAAAERTQFEFAPVSLGIAESRSTLLRRVEAIMGGRSLKRLSRPWALALAVTMVAGAAVSAAVQVRAEPERSIPAAARKVAVQLASTAGLYVASAPLPTPVMPAGVRTLNYYYSAPFQHDVRLSFDIYVGGKRTGDYQAGGKLIPAGPGKHTVSIKVNDRGDKIQLSLDLDGVPAGQWNRAIKARQRLIMDKSFPEKSILDGKPIPIYLFTLCTDDPQGKRMPAYDSPTDVFAAKCDLAIFVMAEVRKDEFAAPASAAPPAKTGAAIEAPGLVYETITVKYWPAQYLLYLFGMADFPDNGTPIPGFLPFVQASKGAGPSPEGGSGPGEMAGKSGATASAKGSLKAFLPEGIKLVAAPGVFSQQLLVAGTPEAVAKLREFIQMVDKKPQQVILEITVREGSPENGSPYSALASDAGMRIVSLPKGETEFRFAGRELQAMRVATMNLVPACNATSVNAGPGQPRQTLITVLPQILGDGTMNLVLRYVVPSDSDDPKAAIAEGSSILATVNVRDGETFGIVSTRGGSTSTITIKPHIVRE
jgi:hypothetical protein